MNIFLSLCCKNSTREGKWLCLTEWLLKIENVKYKWYGETEGQENANENVRMCVCVFVDISLSHVLCL